MPPFTPETSAPKAKDVLQKRDPLSIMMDMAETYARRSRDYIPKGKPGHEVHADIIRLLWPEGIPTDTPGAATKFVLLNNIITKMVRYALLLESGGHEDSAVDMAVYSAILASYHEEPK